MQGCHTPLPPPSPWYPPLPVKWVVVFFGLVAFPSGLVWPRPLPPLWSGTCGLFGWPRPPVGGSVFYRGMVWLLPLVSTSSNVIDTCLVPSPPCGVGPVVVLVGPAQPVAVCFTEIWYGCCHLLVVMSSLRARYHTKYDVALFSLQTVCPVPALCSCEEALAGIILHRPPSLWFVWVRPRPGAGGGEGIPWGGGGWGPGTREHI